MKYKNLSSSDLRLGMNRSIDRRDFLNGMALLGGAALAPRQLYAQDTPQPLEATSDYYPPLLQGLRGSHPGSFETAHALRDGWVPPTPIDTAERYDLIIVGAGISGLSAAHFYRQRTSASSRILLLDNHDDFGGHAKRNEFHLDGKLHLLNGGTLEIDSPRPYGTVAANLLKELGIDVPALAKRTQHLDYYEGRGLTSAVFFDRETFGADHLASGMGKLPYSKFLARAPLSARARQQIVQIEEAKIDYLPDLSPELKKDRLSRMSYEAFLKDLVKADEPAVLAYYNASTHGEYAVGSDAISALDCWALGFAGFQGMNLPKGSIARMGNTAAGYSDTGGSFKLHFPDGNATIARRLVRSLVPGALPGQSVEDLVTARCDYSQLDQAEQPVRIRLSSIAVQVRNSGTKGNEAVEVQYMRGGTLHAARAGGVVLACYNMVIPYLCPELPDAQKQALHQLIKSPLVYTSVALRNWRAFERLKVSRIYAPGGYHSSILLNPHVNIGRYGSESSPDRPILVHMVRTPCHKGLPEHEQNKAGRADLLATPFETFERNIRDQLDRCLAGGGFEAARDISGITVNRWPHGYAPEYNPLWDPEVPEQQRPHVTARTKCGRVTIANSDAGAAAYTDSAIYQAHRAVGELLDS